MVGLHNFMGMQKPTISVGFKVWMGVCAIAGLTIIGVVIWAVVKIVSHICG